MSSTTTTPEIRPFRVEFPQADLDDLGQRLERTRYAPAAPGDSWDYGTPESYLRDMVERWTAFDWRAVEARITRSAPASAGAGAGRQAPAPRCTGRR